MVRVAAKLTEGKTMGKEVIALPPVPLKRVYDAPTANMSRDQGIERLVDSLMARSPALDRDLIRQKVVRDLKRLAEGNTASCYLTYKWKVVKGVYEVSWPD